MFKLFKYCNHCIYFFIHEVPWSVKVFGVTHSGMNVIWEQVAYPENSLSEAFYFCMHIHVHTRKSVIFMNFQFFKRNPPPTPPPPWIRLWRGWGMIVLFRPSPGFYSFCNRANIARPSRYFLTSWTTLKLKHYQHITDLFWGVKYRELL